MSHPRRKEIFILILCLLIGFALRFHTFDKKSLWLDEIYTFNDSRYDIKDQLKYYRENPTYLHPPLFFILTHQFYPFTKPERDLRIIPLIFGTLSIPMIYLLARLFSPPIALPCALSLTFMAYHISLSQEGRSYALLMFLGLTGTYFFMRNLQTSKKGYLLPAAFSFATLLHTSYSSIPFFAFSQILWFYNVDGNNKKSRILSFVLFNGLILLLCTPWLFFILLNYSGPPVMPAYQPRVPISFGDILNGILHDWVPHLPLIITSVILLVLFPIFSKNRKNASILLAVFFFPVGALYLFCKLLDINHFITSRYFIIFLPLFFITLFLSLSSIENKFEGLRRFVRLRFLFIILFVASNLLILTPYYRSEKEDFRSLANYLKDHLRQGDKLLDMDISYVPGILHYLGILPQGRFYSVSIHKVSENESELRTSFTYQNTKYLIYCSKEWSDRYLSDGGRLWIIVGHDGAKRLRKNSQCVLKGYFNGSFLNFNRFPADASIFLFLWDPRSPDEKGIDMPIE